MEVRGLAGEQVWSLVLVGERARGLAGRAVQPVVVPLVVLAARAVRVPEA